MSAWKSVQRFIVLIVDVAKDRELKVAVKICNEMSFILEGFFSSS